jgi:hypothetical protein
MNRDHDLTAEDTLNSIVEKLVSIIITAASIPLVFTVEILRSIAGIFQVSSEYLYILEISNIEKPGSAWATGKAG